MKVYTPRPYQPIITNAILQIPRVNVFAGMGTGKTSATLEAISSLLLFGDVRRALVIAPKRVAVTTWPGEVKEWGKSFGHLRVAVCTGTDAERRAAIDSGAEVVTINYENLNWLIENYGEHWDFDMAVADESGRLRGFRCSLMTKKDGSLFLRGQGSKRAKAMGRVAYSKVNRWVNLNGTPTPNGLQDLWGQQWFIDFGKRLGNSYTAFKHRWFKPAWGSTPQQEKIEPLPFAEDQIRNSIANVSIAIEAKDYFDLKDPIHNDVLIDLPPKAQALYDELVDEMFVELDGTPIEAINTGVLTQKLLQITSGAIYTEKPDFKVVHDEKIDALASIIEESNGMPLLLFYHWKHDLIRLKKAFPKLVVLDDNPKTQDRFNAGGIQLLAAHPQSAGHGLSLQHGTNQCAFFTTNWPRDPNWQAVERIGPTRQAQSGYDRAVTVHRILARGSIDEVIVARLRSTESEMQAFMTWVKANGFSQYKKSP